MKSMYSVNIILSIILFATLILSVNGKTFNQCYVQASPISAEEPEVILQGGTAGTSTIYMNNTSAKVYVRTEGWKVQSGFEAIPSGYTSTTVNINPVNLSKSFLLVTFGGGISGNQPEQDVIVSGRFSSPSQLIFERVGTTNPANFAWYVIEALGNQIYVQSGTTEFGSTENLKDVTVADVGDVNKCVVFLSRRTTGTDRTQYNKAFVTGELTSTINLRLRREGTGTTVTVEWFVVRFNEETSIQTGETTISTSNPTIQSISPIDPSRTWLYFTWRATQNGLAQVSVRGWLENSSEIRFFRQTTRGVCYVRWFVIQMPLGTSVQSGFHDSTVTTENVKDITISQVNLNSTFSFTTCDSTGTGNLFPRPFWIETITTATNLHLQRWYTGQASDHNWQVIQLPTTMGYVLQVKNQAETPWKIRLRAFNQSNIERLSNCTIYFYNNSDASLQIYILNGEYNQQYGEWYDLTSYNAVNIAITASATNTETSYIYAYLEILTPDTTTYNLLIITFEIS